MERDELYNARDLAYHMTEEDYEDMMQGELGGFGPDGDLTADEWEDEQRAAMDDEEDYFDDDREFERFQENWTEEDSYDEGDLYGGWDNEIEQGRWDE